jgi:hypothetical protein
MPSVDALSAAAIEQACGAMLPITALDFEQVIKQQSNHAQALYYAGACYLQTGNAAVGRAYLKRYDRLVARGGRVARLPHQIAADAAQLTHS